MKTGLSDRSEQSHPLARNIKFWTLREQSTFYHITLLAQVFMLPVLARNYGQRFPDIAGQSERRESLRLASPIWKWRRAPSFCCGHIISSPLPPPPRQPCYAKKPPALPLALFPCPALTTVSSIYPSTRFLLAYCFCFLPTGCKLQESRDHMFLLSTLGLEHVEQCLLFLGGAVGIFADERTNERSWQRAAALLRKLQFRAILSLQKSQNEN